MDLAVSAANAVGVACLKWESRSLPLDHKRKTPADEVDWGFDINAWQ